MAEATDVLSGGEGKVRCLLTVVPDPEIGRVLGSKEHFPQ